MDIKLVALDLDDTLLDKSLTVSPRTREVIAQAIAQGVTVTVATGRMYSSALIYAKQLELDVPLITYNGGLIRRVQSGETLYHKPVDEQVAREVLALFGEKGWYIQSYVDDILYVAEHNETSRYYERMTGIKAVALGDAFYTMAGAPTKMLALTGEDKMGEIEQTIRSVFGDRLYIARSKPTYLEMTNPQVNKGHALAFLADKLHITRDQVMAVGDGPNDLDMIEYAGWGVAMGNAAANVKAAAKAVTGHHDADGVAEAIEKYVLQK
jgi:hypothetical protein